MYYAPYPYELNALLIKDASHPIKIPCLHVTLAAFIVIRRVGFIASFAFFLGNGVNSTFAKGITS